MIHQFAKRTRLLAAIPFIVLLAGCSSRSAGITSPSPSTAALDGSWSSVQAVTTSACSNFLWVVTDESGDTAAGTFSATCFGGVPVTGSAHTTAIGASYSWTAVATAPATSCGVSLNGTAHVDKGQMQIDYSGNTCLGDASGTETLQRTAGPLAKR